MIKKFYRIIFILYIFGNVNSFPVLDNFERLPRSTGLAVPPPEIIKFMRRFGYLDPMPSDSEAIYHENAIINAVKNIQKFGALNQTGILDNDTLNLLVSPRCGVRDIDPRQSREKRYIVGAKRWQKRNIKYFIANWSPKIGEENTIKYMKRVFEIWSSYSNLKFKRVQDPSADIIIAFGSGHHGDNYPFDGPGNILAHAFYPYEMQSYGGDIHFDDEENWKENSTNLVDGVDFFSVALHELGHSLGLAHSHIYSSIMFPYYKGPNQNNLDYDDIMAMYELYIKGTFLDDHQSTETSSSISDEEIYTTTFIPTEKSKITSTTPYTTTYIGDYETVDDHKKRFGLIPTPTANPNNNVPNTTTTDIPNICTGNFNAVSVFRQNIYIFKGEYIWKLTDQYRISNGYPIKLHDMFKFLPNSIKSIDAAYERNHDNAIILFSGQQYWIYNGFELIENSPRSITDFGLSINETHINAAMFWHKNQKTYLFSGDKFWRYDEQQQHLDDNYPKPMIRWIGIPNNIDAATTMANGKTYFFKENLYWLYNNKYIRPERGYPRRASNAWLGCPLMQRKPLRNYIY